MSYSTAAVSGRDYVGGLVGCHDGTIATSYSSGSVAGTERVGGLVGYNLGSIDTSYSTGSVIGTESVGGLVGWNHGTIATSYSIGSVTGTSNVGGLVGIALSSHITSSFWDIQTSSQTESAGGTGKTAVEMQTAGTFLDAGWDFVGETANGTEDIWKIAEGKDYPHLWWETTHD